MIYTAEHRSLAILEVLVHIKGGGGSAVIGAPFYVYPVSFDAALVEMVQFPGLSAGWNEHPPTTASQSLGDSWVLAGKSAVLAVPSAIVVEERNYILNPHHPRFREVQIAPPVVCSVDPRLL